MESIVQSEKECYFCKQPNGLHRHHIIFGNGRRAKSEKYGLTVYLCYKHHNGSRQSVHMSRAMDLALKVFAQGRFESIYGHELYMQEFERDYRREAEEFICAHENA